MVRSPYRCEPDPCQWILFALARYLPLCTEAHSTPYPARNGPAIPSWAILKLHGSRNGLARLFGWRTHPIPIRRQGPSLPVWCSAVSAASWLATSKQRTSHGSRWATLTRSLGWIRRSFVSSAWLGGYTGQESVLVVPGCIVVHVHLLVLHDTTSRPATTVIIT